MTFVNSLRIVPFIAIWLITLIPICDGHGRLIEPPSRASAWRYGFQTPPNYNDHELYCGGFTRQWKKNNGKCGECGDAWDIQPPRAHEYGGKWGQGVIVRKYNPETNITLRVELTASHMGYFEFRICPEKSGKQDCLDKHLLKILGGSPIARNPSDLNTRFYPRNGSRIYEIKAELPQGFKCKHCLLQWRYVAGNNWGECPDGSGAVGCGAQEEFRACSDIAIDETGRTTIRPIRPGTKTTIKPFLNETVLPEPGINEYTYRYIGPIIAIFALLVVIFILVVIYLYYYHGKQLKKLLRWKRNKENSQKTSNNINKIEKSNSLAPPIPPPRTKRILTAVKDIPAIGSSVVIGQNKIIF